MTTGIWSELLDGAHVDDATLAVVLQGAGRVEPVTVARRSAQLWARSLKGTSQAGALDAVVATCDLTTLEGVDTPRRVAQLAAKAVRPDPQDPTCPSVAALCVYPDLVADARAALDERGGQAIAVAAVATGFPAGRTSAAIKEAEIEGAVAAGASEIDIVIDRGAFLSGRFGAVLEEIRMAKRACGEAHLKVILETGELGSPAAIYQAALLALCAGPAFIKTSTGKISDGATPLSAYLLCRAVGDFARMVGQTTGRTTGVKAAGGIRSAKDACRYLVMVAETLGVEAVDPSRWRFGASGLLNDVLAQRRHLAQGIYPAPHDLTVA